ncbi:MAG: hypothetical protein UT07_C0014G0012 [Parcubacteria group bacterium GW2011_GWB1_38_8]|uniref:Uncharacterized protein n=1 Tax=Candidatus Zambryskibacteria bacterium RIFCSPLOWO2_02_FULL_39_14 TaxID=1802769 RepID=A0A1G2UHU9_9BACT|nr:MAG: hypothetical protein UT07_C0014G0012 [Parcubacteria group bacterium GW2011_GWB1_38_8]KKR29766.1 MAG: hypothetical protein UT62_C0030G0005 [Parcubacteria group bacterium GW2011_GWC1_39_8]OHA95892.1 MAG: hypothetical protein A3C62_01865 [Candidatus Zambryskibacteria bacterium RIFCSPHIGHO2_02_FULL_39_16]OHB09016.1 MAG: hypothetical protein A3I86_00720 [Candidatus Zambryskibacteria bacterium RIFCSPLOWO2_02_FULL_39_14]
MDILHTFFSKLIFRKKSFVKLDSNPEIDWKIIFISTAILVIITIISSVYMFIKIDKGEIFLVKKMGDDKTRTLDISILRETVSYYQNKAIEFERLKSKRVSTVDPSL